MTQLELQQYLLRQYPQEDTHCEWKEFKNLKNSFCGDDKNDVIGVHDNTCRHFCVYWYANTSKELVLKKQIGTYHGQSPMMVATISQGS